MSVMSESVSEGHLYLQNLDFLFVLKNMSTLANQPMPNEWGSCPKLKSLQNCKNLIYR